MSGKNEIALRLQAPEGQKRLRINPKESQKTLLEKVRQLYEYPATSSFQVHLDRGKERGIQPTSKLIRDLKLTHGDTLYVSTTGGGGGTNESDVQMVDVSGGVVAPEHGKGGGFQPKRNPPQVDPIDGDLLAKDGKIKRGKDKNMCRHNENSSCIYCTPLEPYDEAYLRENGIKHMSFHAYLRKLTEGVDKGKFAALEDINVKIKGGCSTHPPWPKGICSKCQPSAVTLNRQPYRHIDSVMFENPAIVDSFLNYWRITGLQRVGFLYGFLEEHVDVPLGIRAHVVAIYEPPQVSTPNSIRLLPDAHEEAVNGIASSLGYHRLGWVFTDLLPEDSTGAVRHLRGIHSYFLSAQECVMAAELQNCHPNHCSLAKSSDSTFGSKFATVLITGDEKKQIHMVGYQVSNQGMALVRDNCLVPCQKESPEFGWIRESAETQYVPDVFYKLKDEYGNEVSRIARPLPVEYLLVDVPVSTPKEPIFSLTSLNKGLAPFPIENRCIDGHIQDFPALGKYLAQFPEGSTFLEKASDFHFLLYLGTMDIYDLRPFIGGLIEAVSTRNVQAAEEWSSQEHWKSVEQLLTMIDEGGASGPLLNSLARGSPGEQQNHWTCPHCTFFNVGSSNSCEVCQLPKEA